MEAGRNDETFRELIEKEGEQGQENEREVVPIEELRGDRKVVFPSHAWEPRADTGEMPYPGLDRARNLDERTNGHIKIRCGNLLYGIGKPCNGEVNTMKKMKLVSEEDVHRGSIWPSISELQQWKK